MWYNKIISCIYYTQIKGGSVMEEDEDMEAVEEKNVDFSFLDDMKKIVQQSMKDRGLTAKEIRKLIGIKRLEE